MVSLGLVYFMRLSHRYRLRYKEYLDKCDKFSDETNFSDAFKEELDWYMNHVELPPGIALTEGLKENVFATIACTVTKTPLIIVGVPGSSKTLSFNVVVANLKGKQSRVKVLQQEYLYPSLDPHFYQCSRRTTSLEVERIFKVAINRQGSLENSPLKINCVVFMDEAGLPEDRHESLKALHYYLDMQEVAFVGISNHVLDAAKTNRAIMVFRPETGGADLDKLANAFIGKIAFKTKEADLDETAGGDLDESGSASITSSSDLIRRFCNSYRGVLSNPGFKKLFGLRDFIHFLSYLRRNSQESLVPHLILKSLERNFSGTDNFRELSRIFSIEIPELEELHQRSAIKVLRSSLEDYPCFSSNNADDVHASMQIEVRYKLIIDPSEDDSLVRLLFTHGVLQREHTRVYVVSDFYKDKQTEKLRTITQIRHSVSAGHTILMYQTDEIHENFYDLFNQRFVTIKDTKEPSGVRLYTKIAIGAYSKPSRVHQNFQCVIVIKKTELKDSPPPFLNRFEKYCISHHSVLETVLATFPRTMQFVLREAHAKVLDFVDRVNTKKSNLYGFCEGTLDSLMLTMLPCSGQVYVSPGLQLKTKFEEKEVQLSLLQHLLHVLRSNAGFRIPKFSTEELQTDVEHLFHLMMNKGPVFSSTISGLDTENISQLVGEAMDLLYQSDSASAPEPHTDSCMVIQLLLQWLIMYMCKRLLQLMSPEALSVHSGRIPTPYIEMYLGLQDHFGLKEMIKRQLLSLKLNDWEISVCATKLLCFTRSSALIHELTPDIASAVVMDSEHVTSKGNPLKELRQLRVHKVWCGNSQSQIQNLVKDFMSSDGVQVLLLIANMEELSKKMINHLRIMIEEAENRTVSVFKEKLFVLLLHFPPVMFFDSCYPSLFLQGWDHHYLDTVAHGVLTFNEDKPVLDVKYWYTVCCSKEELHSLEDSDCITTALEGTIPEAIPVIVSRMDLYQETDSQPHKVLNAAEFTKVLELLLQKDRGVGKVLATRFRAYWTRNVMIEEMERVVKFLYSTESTLNITDFVQTMFFSLFFDFLTYMLSCMIDSLDIELLCRDQSRELQRLFLELLKVIPVPKLAQLRLLCAMLPSNRHRSTTYRPRFPFFNQVCTIIEKAIEKSEKEDDDDLNSETSGHWQDRDTRRQKRVEVYVKVVKKRLEDDNIKEQKKGNCLGATVRVLDAEPTRELWMRYFTDLVHHKLHLDVQVIHLTLAILESYIGVPKKDNALDWLVALHVRLRVHQLDFTGLNKILRPISRIYGATVKKSNTGTATTPPCAIPTDIQDPKQAVTYIVKGFLESVSSVATRQPIGSDNSDVLWYSTYRDLISMPGLEEDIMQTLTGEVEIQFTAIHATYLVINACKQSGFISESSTVGQSVFEELKGCIRRPSFDRVTDTVMRAILRVPSSVRSGQCVRSFMEGLFAYFFSKHRISFEEEDCQGFLKLANKQTTAITGGNSGWNDHLYSCTSMNVFKFYFSRILDKGDRTEVWKMVGSILTATEPVINVGTYIPPFYQLKEMDSCKVSQPPVMQKPLAHLCFITESENKSHENPEIGHLVRRVRKLAESIDKDTMPVEKRVVDVIRKQAVIQQLLQQLAYDLKDSTTAKKLSNLMNVINHHLDKDTSGGAINEHSHVLTLSLQRQLRSSNKLIDMFKDDRSSLMDVDCMRPLQYKFQSHSKCEGHLFTFFGPDKERSEMYGVYRCTDEAVRRLFTEQVSTRSVTGLRKLAKGYTGSERMVALTDRVQIQKSMAFRMSLWLCVYNHRFDCEQEYSEAVADGICCLQGLIEEDFIALLRSFIYPKKYMHWNKEDVDGECKDPLFELFSKEQDYSNTHLCRAVANMIAVVLALKPRSNHLWYHLFAANSLMDTYVMGFMCDDRIREGCFYDCGVELTDEGRYGRPEYLEFATRSPISLHSRYLVLWTNFAALCVALVSQNAGEHYVSQVLSPGLRLRVRHYCATQLHRLWLFMGNSMKLTIEQECLFVTKCLESLLKLGTEKPETWQKGLFCQPSELQVYENMWYQHILSPNSPHRNKAAYQSMILLKELKFAPHYPFLPTIEDLLHHLVSSELLVDQRYYALSQFVMEYPRLKAAGALLPDLVQLYLWIHTELAYRVTREYAEKRSIADVIDEDDKMYAGTGVSLLYERVRDGYNRYVEVIAYSTGGGPSARKLQRIEDATKLICFLSEQEGLNDWLFIVIADIVEHHNSFLRKCRKVRQPDSNDQTYTYPSEVDEHTCIVGNYARTEMGVFLQLIRRRYCYPLLGCSQKPPEHPFEYDRLQEDVISLFLAGKPNILAPSEHLWKGFEYRLDKVDKLSASIADLESLSRSLHDRPGLKVALDKASVTKLEYDFHAANYHTIMEIAVGLRTAMEHLIKFLQPPSAVEKSEKNLEDMTVPEFLVEVYEDKATTDTSLMIDIGIKRLNEIGIKRVSPHQMSTLSEIKLSSLYSTLEFFVHWIKDGKYDFCELPLDMKQHMKPKDEEAVNNLRSRLPDQYKGMLEELGDVLRLVHSELRMREKLVNVKQKPITTFLRDAGFSGKDKRILLDLIPETVTCQHYVSLRVAIRTQVVALQSEQDQADRDTQNRWEEYDSSIWENELRSLRQEATDIDYDAPFVYDPEAGYGFYRGMEDVEEEQDQQFTLSDHDSAAAVTEREFAHNPEDTSTNRPSEDQLKEAAQTLSVTDVVSFLKEIKLGQYQELFEDEQVNGKLLQTLSADDLKEMGVTNGYHRRKIVAKFEEYLQELVKTL